MAFRAAFSTACLSVSILFGSGLRAEDDPKAKPAMLVEDPTAADETAALAFAQEQHPELAKLLGPMKTAHPKEYQKAIRELSRTSERLGRMKTRFPDRYAVEIDLWKTESRLRLVAAKTAMVDDDERRQQIEELVTQRNALKVRLFEHEKKEAEARIQQLDRQIADLKSQQEKEVRTEVDRLVKSAKSSATRVKTKSPKADAPLINEKPKDGKSTRAPAGAGASQVETQK